MSEALPVSALSSVTPGDDRSLAVYVHWPFCRAKCPYCDFNSHVRTHLDEEGFVDALCRELVHRAALVPDRCVTSIFFGGGTPSLMSGAGIAKLLETIAGLWPLSETLEVTLEANPTSVESCKFASYHDAGVNRLSLGIQALDERALTALGREHSLAEACAALDLAKRYFRRVSFDLIYARPGQSEENWRQELALALSMAGEHLSLYELTLEPGTPFHAAFLQGRFTPLPADEGARLYEVTQELCDAAALPAYEISNHARPGSECRHNLSYWRGGDYVGVGPGAHGRLTFNGARHAQEAVRLPELWREAVRLKGHGLARCVALTAKDIGEEYLLMGLRLAKGISLARLQTLSRLRLDDNKLAPLLAGRLLEREGDSLRVSPAGRLVLDRLLSELGFAR
jgi:oxygen-independent coproporphyrinogen-3 oxidase